MIDRKINVIICLCFSPLIAIAGNPADLSIKLEVKRAIEKGISWLNFEQNRTGGHWGDPQYPALTGLALRAKLGAPGYDEIKNSDKELKRGFDFILSKVQSDGGIYSKGLASYNTSICLMALLQAKDERYQETIKDARKFLINQQSDFDKKGEPDNTFDGGIGYGSTWAHSDLSNTHLAMEALYYAKKTLKTKEEETFDLDWDAAIAFVSKCQNVATSNQEPWVSDHEEDRGGFVYFPGKSMAGERKKSNGEVALRSYGSMSYAGLLSFIYAEMKPSDERVLAVRTWLSKNYSISENPGMGPQGLFYYYHTMSKALSLSGVDQIKDSQGNLRDWRQELALELINQQRSEGFWINENGRWWEKDPILVSCYALLSLERIFYAL
jgi:squalene-hopene/tetraprenyl-beta-curcumene cyclase